MGLRTPIIVGLLDRRSLLHLYLQLLLILYILQGVVGLYYSAADLGTNIILPAGNNRGIVIIGSLTYTPYTSLVSVNKTMRKLGFSESEMVPEIIGALVINNHTYTLRGLPFDNASIIIGEYRVEGRGLNDKCMGCVWIGEGVKEQLDEGIGDIIIARSPYTGGSYPLIIAGIIHTSTAARYEIITNTFTSRILRGASQDDASYIIVKPRNTEELLRLISKISGESAEKGLIEKILYYAVTRSGGGLLVKQYTTPLDVFLARIGVSRITAYLVIGSLLSLSLLGLYIAGEGLVYSNKGVLRILYEAGVSRLKLKIVLGTMTLIITSTSLITSIPLIIASAPLLRINVMGYPVVPRLNVLISAVLTIVAILALNTGIWVARIDEE